MLPIPKWYNALTPGDKMTLLPVFLTLVLWFAFRGRQFFQKVM